MEGDKKAIRKEYEIGSGQTMKEAGIEDINADELLDSVVPACCKAGCEVEPDGYCEHGCPSLLIKLGVI